MKDTQREAEGEAGSTQEACRWTRPLVSRISPRAEGSAKPLSHPGCPCFLFSLLKNKVSTTQQNVTEVIKLLYILHKGTAGGERSTEARLHPTSGSLHVPEFSAWDSSPLFSLHSLLLCLSYQLICFFLEEVFLDFPNYTTMCPSSHLLQFITFVINN